MKQVSRVRRVEVYVRTRNVTLSLKSPVNKPWSVDILVEVRFTYFHNPFVEHYIFSYIYYLVIVYFVC